MSDKSLRQWVIDELDFEPSVDAAHIGISVENGIVTLTGHVDSYAQKLAAERAVQRVRGVRGIAEEIEIRYPSDRKTADDQIAKRALDVIAWAATLPEGAIKVKVENGWATLIGDVEWQYQRTEAENAVRRLSGIAGVTNNVGIKPRVQPQDIKKRIEEALKRNAEVEAQHIRVAVGDHKVTLEGTVDAWHQRAVAERAAWSVPGVTAVEDHLMVA